MASTTQHDAQPAPTFCAPTWLEGFAAAGGGYVLSPDGRLWLLPGGCGADDATRFMGQITGHPEHCAALAAAIERRQLGEA